MVITATVTQPETLIPYENEQPEQVTREIAEVTQVKTVEAKKPVKKADRKTWRDNPNKCDLETQHIRKDNFKCIDKPTTPARTTTVANVSQSCEQWRPLVEKYNWDVELAMAIMQAESGCNPNAANNADNHGVCMGSFGLFQISCHGGQIYDPAKNVAAAWGKYQNNGWLPWGAYTNGAYTRYLQ